jgi:hypothetical protein
MGFNPKYDKKYNKLTMKDRANRNAARRILEKAGRVFTGDGKDVHHKDGNPNNNAPSNLEVRSKKQRGEASYKKTGKLKYPEIRRRKK